jgi:Domain of unknown function (DUF1707)/Cell wall-active antibiotics response 4TMS YvqF
VFLAQLERAQVKTVTVAGAAGRRNLTELPAGSDESMRVSDAERDATVRTLGEQAAVGRLTLAELEDRAGQALTAKTRGELAVLTSDLPQEAGQGAQRVPAAQARKPVRWLVAIMGGSHRRGRFRAVGSINAIAIMGGDEIDLREAEIEGGELTLNLFALMGGANIYVPDSIDLEVGGLSLMGGHEEVGSQRSPRPGAPLVRIRLYNLMSGATIYRLPPQASGLSLREARRLAKLAERGALTPPD